MSLFVPTNGDRNALMNPLREKLWGLDNEVTLANMKTMDERLSELQSQPRFRTILLSAFAPLALMLTALGIYGVLTQSVAFRTREIGVRMALGATRESVFQMILVDALRTVLMGLGLGFAATVFLARTVAGLLYNVSPANPPTLAGISAIVLCVAMLAIFQYAELRP